MANWCITEYWLHGPKDELNNLKDKILEWTSKNYMENGFGENWLGNIVLGGGLETVEAIRNGGNGIPCRGTFCDDIDIDDDYLCFNTETAWAPMPEMWFKIIEKFAPHCTCHYLAIEPGNELYEKYDPGNLHFEGVEYVVDEYHNDCEAEIIVCDGWDTASEEYLEKALRKYYQDNKSSLEDLIERAKEDDVLIHKIEDVTAA